MHYRRSVNGRRTGHSRASLARKPKDPSRTMAPHAVRRNLHSALRTPHSKRPFLVAIVGGSGAGKTWLAEKLRSGLSAKAMVLSLDNFYRDRSHLSPARRAKLNFDHPNAIDWPSFVRVLRACRDGRTIQIPVYDFATHCRRPGFQTLSPKPIIIVEGLWLLHRTRVRSLFDWRVFIEASAVLRLQRRLSRDLASRSRTRSSIREQFRKTVQPMHERFVVSQSCWADLVVKGTDGALNVESLLSRLRQAMKIEGRSSKS
jgi:uridine kinase